MTDRSARKALEVAAESFRRFNEGDYAGFWQCQHPEVVMVTDRHWPGGGEYKGIDASKHFLSQFLEPFSTVRFDQTSPPEEVCDCALFRGHWTGTGAASGIETSSVDFSAVFRERDGFINEVRLFFSDTEAREFAQSQI